MKIKVHYRALTELHSNEDRWLYTAYIQLKAACNDFTRKPGFLNKSEIKPLALHLHINTSTIYKRLKRLTDNGYIQKYKQGYVLTNMNTVLCNNLNFKQSTKEQRLKDGKTKNILYHPYAKTDIPLSSDTNRIIDLMMLYQLINQIIRWNNRKKNGLYVTTSTKRGKNKNAPISIKIALAYLMKAGKYNSKMTVRKMLFELEQLNLIKIKKGQYNEEVELYETNEYLVKHMSKVNWDGLNHQPKPYSDVINNQGQIIRQKKVKKVKVLKPHEVKPKSSISSVEQKFIDQVFAAKSNLVVNGFIPYYFHDKKIRRSMIPTILNKMLADEQMKDIVLQIIPQQNIKLEKKHMSLYDSKAYVYDRNYDYTIDYLTLVNENGNYDPNMTIRTYEQSVEQAKLSRYKQSLGYGNAVTI